MNSSERFECSMRICLVLCILFCFCETQAQYFSVDNERTDPEYLRLRNDAIIFLENARGSRPSSAIFLNGPTIYRAEKIIALVIDLRDSTSMLMDRETISLLQRQKIPVTFFLTGGWINVHPTEAMLLLKDSLFEIENGGLTGTLFDKKYTPAESVDEIELNARRIDCLSHKKPMFFLPSQGALIGDVTAAACFLNEYVVVPERKIYCDHADNITRSSKLAMQSRVMLVTADANIGKTISCITSTFGAMGFSFAKLEYLLN